MQDGVYSNRGNRHNKCALIHTPTTSNLDDIKAWVYECSWTVRQAVDFRFTIAIPKKNILRTVSLFFFHVSVYSHRFNGNWQPRYSFSATLDFGQSATVVYCCIIIHSLMVFILVFLIDSIVHVRECANVYAQFSYYMEYIM